MVTLTPDTPATADHESDQRRRVGIAVAAAWVLTQLWFAAPLAYRLEAATGLDLTTNATQARGLHLGFALCLAFVLFPPRWLKSPWKVDIVLAVIAGIAASIVAWHYDHISLNPVHPGAFALAVAFVGLAMLALASLRVFGWLGVVLLALVVFAHLSPYIMGLERPAHLRGFELFLNRHWFTTESVFGLFLGISADFVFVLVLLGVALDVMGYGRPLVRFLLRWMPRDIDRDELAERHSFARRFWALTFFLFALSLTSSVGADQMSFGEFAEGVVWLSSKYAAIFIVFLGFAWAAGRLGKGRWRTAGLTLTVGGMLFAVAQVLALILAALLQDVFRGGAFSLRGVGGLAAWLWIGMAFSIAVTYLAWSSADLARRKIWLAALAVLPFVLLAFELSVERVSPALAAFFAAVLMLIVLAERHAVERRQRDPVTAEEPGSLASHYLLPVCHGTARVMVRVAIFAALTGMIIPFAWAFSGLLE